MPALLSGLKSPLVIRGKMLKSRFMYPIAQVHFLQGPELYPAEPTVSFYEKIAKNGCALVLTQDTTNPDQRKMPGHDTPHFSMWDMEDKACQNYFCQLTEFVHMQNSFIGVELSPDRGLPYCVNDPNQKIDFPHPGSESPEALKLKEDFGPWMDAGPEGRALPNPDWNPAPKNVYFTEEKMDEYIDIMCQKALKYKNLGYDAGLIDMGDHFYIGQFLESYCNFRTDEYGGSFENRMRFAVKVVKEVRRKLGNDFILVGNMPGTNGMPRGPMMGLTDEESAKFLKAIEPYVDIALIREADCNFPLEPKESETIPYAKKMKDMGVKIKMACATPYMDLQKMDDAITSGSCDIIMSARMFLCNDELEKILETGEADDLVPCIECGVCRGTSPVKDWMSHCTINPKLGMEHRAARLVRPVEKQKKIAIIGGGPGGVTCALWLKERGHTPVIFEKADKLGGQVSHSNQSRFKWKMERYLDYLRHQVEKQGIALRLNTTATPETIAAEEFDVVIAATGAHPKAPKIAGVQHAKYNPINVYDHLEEIGKRVVVIGSTSAPTEAALFLADNGHEVTQIGRQNIVAYDLNPIHQRAYYNLWVRDFGVTEIHNAVTTDIAPGKVTYRDSDGAIHEILCDDIVAAGGMEPSSSAAEAFYGCAPEFYAIGDCRSIGTMRTAIRDAYTLAIRI